jgi:nucleoid DNA-binding protein
LKIDIAESIREVLCEREPVSIYGLGTLELKQHPARYGDQRVTLLPPSTTLEFKESSSTNARLIQWLIDKYELGQQEAELLLKQFSERVLNTLLNYRKVSISGVAYFERNGDNEIKFEAAPSLLAQFYKAFPEVKLKSKTTTAGLATPLPENESADSQEKLISGQEDESPIESSADIEQPEQASSLVSDEEENLPEEDFDINMSWGASDERDKGKGRRVWGLILIAVAIIAAAVLIVDACRHLRSKAGNDKEATATENSPLVSASTQDSVSAAIMEKDFPAEAISDSCIIVTGVFGSAANVAKMSQRIEQAGYEIYIEDRNGFTRVGLSFECMDVDNSAFIKKIRSEISAKAWYLKPDLYVPFAE